MSPLLLDTHVFVWAVIAPHRLSPTALTHIEDPENRLVVSAATAWEVATKFRLGKLPEAEVLVHQYEQVVERLRGEHLPVDARHALRSGSLSWSHSDPFDRMLAAQSLIENIPLISRDRAFGELPGLAVVW